LRKTGEVRTATGADAVVTICACGAGRGPKDRWRAVMEEVDLIGLPKCEKIGKQTL